MWNTVWRFEMKSHLSPWCTVDNFQYLWFWNSASIAGLWSRSWCLSLETYQRLISVSSRDNCQRFGLVSVSWGRLLGLGYLHLVPKTNFRPNWAGHINKTSQFWASWDCFTFTVASAGAFCIHSRWVSKSSVDRYTLLTCACVKIATNETYTLTSRSRLENYKRLFSVSSRNFNVSSPFHIGLEFSRLIPIPTALTSLVIFLVYWMYSKCSVCEILICQLLN